jgi:hypothetical protein
MSDDPLAPARGVVIGVLLGSAFWMALWLVGRYAL